MYFLHTISLKCLYINQGDLEISIPLKSGKKYPLVWPCRVVYDTHAFGLWSELIKYNIFSMQVWQLECPGTVNQITKDYQCPAQIIISLKLSEIWFSIDIFKPGQPSFMHIFRSYTTLCFINICPFVQEKLHSREIWADRQGGFYIP